MEIRLISAAIALLIGGCGGGSEDTGTTTPPTPPVPPPTVTQYTASASLVAGGKLTPASQKVDAGKSASFSVQADAGFVLDNISGCGGSLAELTYTTAAMTADCAITPAFISNAENAIRHQDHTLASANELIDFGTAKLASIAAVRKAQITQLYQGVGSSISWHPTHDSITFSSFMPENTFTLLPSNVDGSGASAVRGLVMAGEQQGLRYAAMGGNLFSVNTSAQTDVLLKNLISWLTQGSDQRDGLSIVTAQMPSRADSWYFPHNEGIRTWLATHYPNAHSINTANSCDYSALASC
ncbi:MAG: ImpA family metalloprotease, partial [Shewanella sp.]